MQFVLDLLVEAGGDGLPRRCQGERISGKGARVVAEQVARELVEHDDERKRAVRRLSPSRSGFRLRRLHR